MKKIAFICTGNTCRSPMAEGIFNSIAKDYTASSMGLFPSFSGAAKNAITVMDSMGIDIANHVSKGLSGMDDYELILTMTEDQSRLLKSELGLDNIYSLKEFTTGKAGDVADPYGGDLKEYELTANELKELIIKLVKKLEGS
ncbi:low molecular weight protein arginine phosphatase [Microaceticoccus formicicus]|uniref:low molecular weight protein arginine phosphatase n=1 Tax=Microaceticoccus formicicus TaxID=3118105 RepID=UPI003CD0271D|nr:low molecular weight protein arginine phosphatase [Peptoniphilaceae bacterium AMB_02]